MATNKSEAASTKADTELDTLYKNYDVLVNAKEKIAEVPRDVKTVIDCMPSEDLDDSTHVHSIDWWALIRMFKYSK